MTETWLRRRRVRDRFRLVFATYEQTFIQAFEPKLHDVVAAGFAARAIEGRTGTRLQASRLARRSSRAARTSRTTSSWPSRLARPREC